MKKSILNVGKTLNKAQQKLINGGGPDDPISGFPGSGGGSGSGSGISCFCLMNKHGGFYPIYVDCNSLCADGSTPLSS